MTTVLYKKPFLKTIYTKRKELAPNGSKLFSFRIDSFSEARQKNDLDNQLVVSFKSGPIPLKKLYNTSDQNS